MRRHFTKKQADRLLWKLYKHINNKTARIRLDRSIAPDHGWLFYEKPNKIIINPDKQIIHCFVHEYLHIFYPNKHHYLTQNDYENWILEMEDELVNHHWSMRQLENLLKRASKLIRFRK